MKPIIRWTIGNVHHAGFQTLAHSVKLFKRVYNNFDLFVCHNVLSDSQIDFLKSLNVNLVKQSSGTLICEPRGVAWKLYPPRIDITRHEIFIDNDVLIFKTLDEIQWFLDSDKCFIITEALRRLFGHSDKHVPEGLKLNSGLFGIPPRFDFAQAINECESHCWQDRYDEQGVVATIICRHNYKMIPLTKIAVCYDKFICGTHGIHFCGVNSGLVKHWDKFLSSKLL
jgi:hypothetical protein